MTNQVIREDLVVRYHHVKKEGKSPATGTIAQTLPMASMFMRNKMLSWVAFSICVQHFMNYRHVQLSDDASSPTLSLVLAAMSVITAYMDILVPLPSKSAAAAASKASETIAAVSQTVSEAISSATSL